MKALTIRQPWAHAIIRDGKDVENRTWAAQYPDNREGRRALARTWKRSKRGQRR